MVALIRQGPDDSGCATSRSRWQRFAKWGAELDSRVFGDVEDDARPLAKRLWRPGSAVRSTRGRVIYGALLAGFFAAMRWLPDRWTLPALVLFVLAFYLVIVFDGRLRRSEKGHRSPDGS